MLPMLTSMVPVSAVSQGFVNSNPPAVVPFTKPKCCAQGKVIWSIHNQGLRPLRSIGPKIRSALVLPGTEDVPNIFPSTMFPLESVATTPSWTLQVVLCPFDCATVSCALNGPKTNPVTDGVALVREDQTAFCRPPCKLGICCQK